MASVRLGEKFCDSGVSKSGGGDVLASLDLAVADVRGGLSTESLAFLEKQPEEYRRKIMLQLRAGVQNSGAKKFTPN
ncbi:MAG: hypothetical protein KAI61_08000 [Alphaproteobacteria bacterium]|nr:hypothetical protein [Alphaproteobacteria bacterium]